MDKKKAQEQTKKVVVEFSVSMYCNACERTVAKTISKFKGVEKYMTDMNKHRVVVTGKIDPQKVLKKLRKKTGKRVEIIPKNDNNKSLLDCRLETPKEEEGNNNNNSYFNNYYNNCNDTEMLMMMFNDENPNACSLM
ncbi:hypothetical protein CsatB_026018 [Cannabis sativa]